MINRLWIDESDLTLLIIFLVAVTLFCSRMYSKASIKEYIKNYIKQNKILSVFLAITFCMSINSFLRTIYSGESFGVALTSAVILLAGYWAILIYVSKWIKNGGVDKLLSKEEEKTEEEEEPKTEKKKDQEVKKNTLKK